MIPAKSHPSFHYHLYSLGFTITPTIMIIISIQTIQPLNDKLEKNPFIIRLLRNIPTNIHPKRIISVLLSKEKDPE